MERGGNPIDRVIWFTGRNPDVNDDGITEAWVPADSAAPGKIFVHGRKASGQFILVGHEFRHPRFGFPRPLQIGRIMGRPVLGIPPCQNEPENQQQGKQGQDSGPDLTHCKNAVVDGKNRRGHQACKIK